MSDKAHVHTLLTEIGPLLELGEVTAFDAEDLWTLVFDADTVVFADYDPERQRLWLSAEIGAPLPADRSGFYETLLTYNHRWRDTGGLRVSLDGPGGEAVLAYDLPAAGLEVSRLRQVLVSFVDVLRAWREGLSQLASGSGRPANAAEAPFNPMMMGMIRG